MVIETPCSLCIDKIAEVTDLHFILDYFGKENN